MSSTTESRRGSLASRISRTIVLKSRHLSGLPSDSSRERAQDDPPCPPFPQTTSRPVFGVRDLNHSSTSLSKASKWNPLASNIDDSRSFAPEGYSNEGLLGVPPNLPVDYYTLFLSSSLNQTPGAIPYLQYSPHISREFPSFSTADTILEYQQLLSDAGLPFPSSHTLKGSLVAHPSTCTVTQGTSFLERLPLPQTSSSLTDLALDDDDDDDDTSLVGRPFFRSWTEALYDEESDGDSETSSDEIGQGLPPDMLVDLGELEELAERVKGMETPPLPSTIDGFDVPSGNPPAFSEPLHTTSSQPPTHPTKTNRFSSLTLPSGAQLRRCFSFLDLSLDSTTQPTPQKPRRHNRKSFFDFDFDFDTTPTPFRGSVRLTKPVPEGVVGVGGFVPEKEESVQTTPMSPLFSMAKSFMGSLRGR